MDEKESVRKFIFDNCIIRAPRGSYELPALGGGFYTWQFYLRAATLNPYCLHYFIEDFWQRFKDEEFQLAGVESSAVPIMTAIILEFAYRGKPINGFTIRKERKGYGLKNLIEGIPNDLPVLLVDDLTSAQHNTFWHAVEAIKSEKLRLFNKMYVIVRKQNEDDDNFILTSFGPIVIESPFSLEDFKLSIRKE